jgi:RNA exonuclease 4
MVNEWCQPQFNVLIKQDKPVLSYITPLTGLTKEMVDQYGQPLADALAVLRSHLSPNAVLVGQNILKDVQWLQLAEGVDYGALIDLAALFRCWNPVRGEYTGFSQDHCAKAWLGVGDRPNHDALSDSVISMSLFNAYRSVQKNPEQLFQLQQATMNTPRVPGFSATHPTVDGCCMGNRKSCKCGAPNFY